MSKFDAYRPQLIAQAVRQPDFAGLTRRARRRRQRLLSLAAGLVVLAVAIPAAFILRPAGGPAQVGSAAPSLFTTRAASTVDAYERSGLAYVASRGVFPRQELTVLTKESKEKPGTFNIADTFPSEVTYEAFLAGRFRLAGSLPVSEPSGGQVVLPTGTSVDLPLAPAQAAFAAMDKADEAPDGTILSVTNASLGTVSIQVLGGSATVPAWLFTVEGLRAPIARVALASSDAATEVLRQPAELLPKRTDGLWSTYVFRVAPIAGDATRLLLSFTGGQCDLARTAAVYETSSVVVAGVNIIHDDRLCPAIGLPLSLEVNLAAPLGNRLIIGMDGLPVPRTG